MAGQSLQYMTTALCLAPNRYAEQRADRLSDKFIPEVTYKQNYDSFFAPIIGGMSKEPARVQRKQARLHVHPSNHTRTKKSEINCAKFLIQKQELGIPAFRPMTEESPSTVQPTFN